MNFQNSWRTKADNGSNEGILISPSSIPDRSDCAKNNRLAILTDEYANAKTVNRKSLFLFIALGVILMITYAVFIGGGRLVVLNPQGTISLEERNLIATAVLLMLTIVIPALVMTFYFAWRYRAGNTKEIYAPDWSGNPRIQLIWWVVPAAVISILALITWRGTHALDPYKPIASDEKPLTIQVVALRWKWLFIYPDLNIATVNTLELPVGTPLNFELTADAPMSSFWIPALGGQMYAMAGMTTQLHLLANAPGTFKGSNAEISGAGFSSMTFPVKALSRDDFNVWVLTARASGRVLNADEYATVAKPSENAPIQYYSSVQDDLYTMIMMSYMMPMPEMTGSTEPTADSHY